MGINGAWVPGNHGKGSSYLRNRPGLRGNLWEGSEALWAADCSREP